MSSVPIKRKHITIQYNVLFHIIYYLIIHIFITFLKLIISNIHLRLLERPFVFNVSLKFIKAVKLATQCCLQNGVQRTGKRVYDK